MIENTTPIHGAPAVGAVDERDGCKSDDAGCRKDRCVDTGGKTLEQLHEQARILGSGPACHWRNPVIARHDCGVRRKL